MARTDWERSIDFWIDQLRRTGQVITHVDHVPDADTWRREMRSAARRAGLRIRTGLGHEGTLWAYHVDHVVTPAAMAAGTRALLATWAGEPVPDHEQLVREEQRKLMQIVPTDPEA